MKRFLMTFLTDARLQFRNGFYAAALLVSGFVVLVLRQFPEPYLARFLPLFVMQNLTISVFYFIGGLVLLEKDQGTLQAQAVTPLRREEYLLAKIASLGGLALVESLAVVLLAYGVRLNWGALLAALVVMIVGLALYGFLVVLRYDSVNAYLLPSLGFALLLSLPLVDYLGVWHTPLMYLHPFQAPLVLLRGLFVPLAGWEWLYGVGYSALWIGLLFRWSRSRFDRYVRGWVRV